MTEMDSTRAQSHTFICSWGQLHRIFQRILSYRMPNKSGSCIPQAVWLTAKGCILFAQHLGYRMFLGLAHTQACMIPYLVLHLSDQLPLWLPLLASLVLGDMVMSLWLSLYLCQGCLYHRCHCRHMTPPLTFPLERSFQTYLNCPSSLILCTAYMSACPLPCLSKVEASRCTLKLSPNGSQLVHHCFNVLCGPFSHVVTRPPQGSFSSGADGGQIQGNPW